MPAPGEHTGEDLDEHGEAVALVAAERHRREDLVGIGGGVALLVDAPALGDRAPLVARVEDLVVRDLARRHVDVEDPRRGRRRERDRVGPQRVAEAAEGDHERLGVRGRDPHQAGARRADRVVGRRPVVARAVHGHRADAVAARELDREVGGEHAGDLSRAVVGVDQRDRAVLALHLGRGLPVHRAGPQALRVDRQARDPVGVDAAAVGGDERDRDGLGRLRLEARARQQRLGPALELGAIRVGGISRGPPGRARCAAARRRGSGAGCRRTGRPRAPPPPRRARRRAG